MTDPSFGIIFKKLSPINPRFFQTSLNARPTFLFVSYFKFSNFLIALFLSFILFSLYSIRFDLIFETGLKILSLRKLDLKSL